MQLKNVTRNIVICENVEVANTFFTRLKGLLGRKSLAANHTLWINPCNSIHTWFMKFSIDVVFVNSDMVVQRVYSNIHPYRLVLPASQFHSVFEFASGAISEEKVQVGDQLYVGT